MDMMFKLDIDEDGNPEIIVKHEERNGDIENRLLGVMISKMLENGVEIKNRSGKLLCGTSNSWEKYVIKPQKDV